MHADFVLADPFVVLLQVPSLMWPPGSGMLWGGCVESRARNSENNEKINLIILLGGPWSAGIACLYPRTIQRRGQMKDCGGYLSMQFTPSASDWWNSYGPWQTFSDYL